MTTTTGKKPRSTSKHSIDINTVKGKTMKSLSNTLSLLCLLLCSKQSFSFSVSSHSQRGQQSHSSPLIATTTRLYSQDGSSNNELSVLLDPQLTDERTKSLFAWISRAFVGDEEYNNLMLAMAAIFGTNLPDNSLPVQLVERGELTEIQKYHI